MNNDIIRQLTLATLNRQLDWIASSNPFELYSYYEGVRYSVECRIILTKGVDYVLCKWDNEGNPLYVEGSENHRQRLGYLFDCILKSNEELNLNFQTFYKKMKESKDKEDRNYSVSLHKVMERLGYESTQERPHIRIVETESFHYKSEDSNGFMSRYVQPPMSQMPTSVGITPYLEAEVMLISAPGATGKTAMSEYLSYKLGIPVLNLGRHDAVGANSIAGILMQQVEQDDVFIYHSGLKTGQCAMIIDGLDEASIHISWESFDAFLKNVAFFSKGAKGLPFVILGRPGVMEDAALILEENGIKVSLLQIEPFTVKKAEEFIDNQMPREYIQRYYQQYRQVRDYIIEQIGGFFKSESELNKKLFERFIGYAPVLQSISNLLKDEKDYHNLLDELRGSKKQKIELLIDIVRRIMQREQGKIRDEVLPQLFEAGRPQIFKDNIIAKSGEIREQCRRILARYLEKDVVINVAGERLFDELYNEKVNTWIKNHPFFLGNEKKIQNVVFESYLIAMLIDDVECRDDVLEYLTLTGSCSYLLLDIYSAMSGKENAVIDHRFFPFLYESFKALDHPQDIGTAEIVGDVSDDGIIKCFLSFGRDESDVEYDFTFDIGKDEWLSLPAILSSLNIDAPINVELAENKLDIQAPISISCKQIRIKSKDILLSTPRNNLGSIVMKSDTLTAICDDGSVPSLIFRTPTDNNKLVVMTESELGYPFRDHLKRSSGLVASDAQLNEAFQKMRRMILMFRSHSKGVLARYCEKINSRIGKSPIGEAIIEGLQKEGVLYSDNIMYYINIDRFGEVLGAKYDDIRSSEMNEKTMAFLKSIQKSLS